VVAKAAVEAVPAHCSAMEQAMTLTAASDDEKDKKATLNRCDGNNKKQ